MISLLYYLRLYDWGILVWSGGFVTLTYVSIPLLPQQKVDPIIYVGIQYQLELCVSFGIERAKRDKEKS